MNKITKNKKISISIILGVALKIWKLFPQH